MRHLLAALALTLAAIAPAAAQSDPVYEYGGDAEMEVARDAAVRSYPQFLAALRAAPAAERQQAFLVKVGLDRSIGGVEHIWVEQLRFEGDALVGVLANEPQHLTGRRRGSPVTIEAERVSDWSYISQDGLYGNFTTRVMLDDIDPQTAAQLRAMLTPDPIPADWAN